MSPRRTNARRHRISAAVAAAALLAGLAAISVPAAASAALPVCPPVDDYGTPPDSAYAMPFRPVAGNPQAGIVRIVSACGLPTITLTVRSLGFDQANPYTRFGQTVRLLDFDGDGFDDLLVSAPGQGDGNGAQKSFGAVGIVFGSPNGIGKGRPVLRLVPPGRQNGDFFGTSVAVQTTHSSSGAPIHHVFVGAPGVNVGTVFDAGAVFHFRLSPGGTSVASVTRWVQGQGGIPGKAEEGDRFGEHLSGGGPAAGAATSNGTPFVAIGVPHEGVGKAAEAGALYVVSGTGFTHAKVLTQATRGVPGTAERGDHFGFAVLAADGGGYGGQHGAGVGGSVVYVGVPGEDVGRAKDAGAVQRIAVSKSAGLSAGAPRGQFSPGVPGAAESGDRLGYSLALKSYYEPGDAEVATGAPGEDVRRAKNAGAVTTLAFRVAKCRFCSTKPRTDGAPTTDDRVGFSLTPTYSMSDGDTYYSYLVGVPGEDAGSRRDVGALEWSLADDAGRFAQGEDPNGRLGEVPSAVVRG